VIDFLFAIIEVFRYLLRLRRHKQILVEVGAFQSGWVNLSANFRWNGTSPPNHCLYQKTRVFLLPYSEDRMILPSFFWIGYQRVTDGQTDRQTDIRNCCRYYSALHCRQCGRAAKIASLVLNIYDASVIVIASLKSEAFTLVYCRNVIIHFSVNDLCFTFRKLPFMTRTCNDSRYMRRRYDFKIELAINCADNFPAKCFVETKSEKMYMYNALP